jgi:hypothetical protein
MLARRTVHLGSLDCGAMLFRAQAKFRADDTTSERQLIVALAQGGRELALSELVGWRKDGLLPPLASTGTGTGRSYYWREPNIQPQAEVAYDALQKHGRVDLAVISLWLRGFSVPLPQLRRAWLYRSKLARPLHVRAARPAANSLKAPGSGVSRLLLQTLVCAGATVEGTDDDRAIISALKAALKRLGLDDGESDTGPARQLWQLVAMFTATMENGTLVRDASDQEMLDTQRYLRKAMTFLENCRESEWPADMIEGIGNRAFILILTLLRSGQEELLETVSARIAAASGRCGIRPAEPVHARA